MSPPSEKEQRFVRHLEGLAAGENRAPLAALRRGLGKRPGEAAEAYRYVVPWLDPDTDPAIEEAYYLVAALFAWHPGPHVNPPANLGASLYQLASGGGGDGVERRFTALLNARREDLPEHLRHAVGLLRSKEVAVNWARLLHDILSWNRERRPVQRAWARAFWREEAQP